MQHKPQKAIPPSASASLLPSVALGYNLSLRLCLLPLVLGLLSGGKPGSPPLLLLPPASLLGLVRPHFISLSL